MRHLIIGVGTVGFCTGQFLEANKEEVYYNDTEVRVVTQLRKKGYKIYEKQDVDIIWICTHEKHVEEIVKNLDLHNTKSPVLVIRSTVPVGTTRQLREKYNIYSIAHNPEFLREQNKLDDTFNPDRIIIGTDSNYVAQELLRVYASFHIPKIVVTPTESELIKYASNCWLSTQTSYWNEIKKICDKVEANPQAVANGATLDKRISKYGTSMIGKSFKGSCLPKDLDSLINTYIIYKTKPTLLSAVKKVNENVNGSRKGEDE